MTSVAVPLERVERLVDHWVGQRPRLHAERCTAARHDRAGCEACQDACRPGALRIDPVSRVVEIDAEGCTGCDACVAACPTGALATRAPRPASRSISCQVAAGAAPGHDVVACVGGIAPGTLLELAAGGDVTLVVGDCSSCERGSGGSVGDRAEAVDEALTALDWPHRVSVRRVSDPPPVPAAPAATAAPAASRGRRTGPEVSRRGFLRFAGIGLRDTAGAAFAAPPEREVLAWADPTRDGRPTPVGAALGELAAASSHGAGTPIDVGGLPLATPTVGATCDLCGACAAFCPTGALRLVSTDDRPATLDVDVSACAGCGLCEAICPTRAVALVPSIALADLRPGRRVLHGGAAPRPTGRRGPMTTAAAFAAHLPPVSPGPSRESTP